MTPQCGEQKASCMKIYVNRISHVWKLNIGSALRVVEQGQIQSLIGLYSCPSCVAQFWCPTTA